jgi:hypothetical protein
MDKLKNYVLSIMEKIPMEDGDIKNILGNNQPILLYSDLNKYSDITEILQKKNSSIIILYEQAPNIGHWCCIKRINNDIYYFNSYGGEIDEPLNWSKNNNQELGQGRPILKELLLKTPLNVYYNKYSFQNPKNLNITTCGLHCIAFIKSNMSLQDYYKKFIELKNKYKLSNDKLITKIIINLITKKNII